jgi:hypothetical protein
VVLRDGRHLVGVSGKNGKHVDVSVESGMMWTNTRRVLLLPQTDAPIV